MLSPIQAQAWRQLLQAAVELARPASALITTITQKHLTSTTYNNSKVYTGIASCVTDFNQHASGLHQLSLRHSSTEATSAVNKHRRFYKLAQVVYDKDQNTYQVHLDNRPVKTPGKHTLNVPSYTLALAIANEWNWQATGKPQSHSMPIMSLAATAIDQPKPREKVIDTLLKYVETDATCCRVEDPKVAAKQAQVHDPLRKWAADELGWHTVASADLFAPPQPEATFQSVRMYLQGLSPFRLAAIEQLTAVCKSVVIAAALLHGRITIQEAIRAARVEEDCQVAEWGTVEAGHDLDEADIATRVSSPPIFLRLLELEK